MKKSDQRLCSTNSVVVAKNSMAVSSKRDNESKVPAKPERKHTSKVKFKDIPECAKVKRNKSVQFVRNTNKPVKKNHSVVSYTPYLEEKQLSDDNNENSETILNDDSNICNKLKLDAPELCSSLRFANKLLEEALLESKTASRSTHFDNACSSKSTKLKVLRKVNIPFEEQMYKDLVDLRFTESDLFPEQEKRLRTKSFVRNKEKEPELSEFYTPSFNQEFVIKPEQVKVEPDKINNYNGFSISDKTKQWESS